MGLPCPCPRFFASSRHGLHCQEKAERAQTESEPGTTFCVAWSTCSVVVAGPLAPLLLALPLRQASVPLQHEPLAGTVFSPQERHIKYKHAEQKVKRVPQKSFLCTFVRQFRAPAWAPRLVRRAWGRSLRKILSHRGFLWGTQISRSIETLA